MAPRTWTAIVGLCLVVAVGLAADDSGERLAELDRLTRTDPATALSEAEEILARARDQDQQEVVIQALTVVAHAQSKLNLNDAVIATVDRALPVARGAGARLAEADLLTSKAFALSNLGEYEAGLAAVEAAVAITSTHTTSPLFADALTTRAQLNAKLNRYAPALIDLQRAYEILQVTDDRDGLWSVLTHMALIHDALRNADKAIAYYEQAMAYLDREGQPMNASIIIFNLGVAYQRSGRHDLARERLEEALELSRGLEDTVGVAYAEARLGELDVAAGDLDRAEQRLLATREVFEEVGDIRMVVRGAVALAEIAVRRHRHGQALDIIAATMPLAERLEVPQHFVDLFELKSRAEEARGRPDLALASLKEAARHREEVNRAERERSLQELEVRFDTSRTEAENALLLKENQVAQLELARQRSQQRFYTFLLLATAGLLVLILLFIRHQREVRRQLRELAMTDPLTGVANRRHILSLAEKEASRAQRYGLPLSLAILDIDLFKSVNDTFGHDVGDLVLKAFAAGVDRATRAQDLLGRLGGEEWLLIMAHTGPHEAVEVLNRVQGEVNQLEIGGVDDGRSISFSAGVVTPQAVDGSLEETLNRADRALYAAKRGGRQRVELG